MILKSKLCLFYTLNFYFRQLSNSSNSGFCVFSQNKSCFHSSSQAPVVLQGLNSGEKIIGDVSNRSDCQRVFGAV